MVQATNKKLSTFAEDLLACRLRLEGLLTDHADEIPGYEATAIRDAWVAMSDLLFVEEYLQD